jgi:protein NrfC
LPISRTFSRLFEKTVEEMTESSGKARTCDFEIVFLKLLQKHKWLAISKAKPLPMAWEILSMAKGKQAKTQKKEGKKYSRRDFVVGGGTVLAGGALAAYVPPTALAATKAAKSPNYTTSTGYLVYDSRRCSGCQSCMIACSLVHEGAAGASLSRIQVSRAILTRYPYDIQISVCRQCPEPMCVKSCPSGACHVSTANGNVRMIDAAKCIGCGECLKACPHSPHRTVWNPAANKAAKCDLCANAPYFSKKGGPAGSQACVTTCPMGALKLVAALPSQTDVGGYDINLAPPPQPKVNSGGLPPSGADPAAKPPSAAPKQ